MAVYVLIPCGKSKLPNPAKVRDLYQGSLFKLSVSWAESHGFTWVVISALHGVLLPEQIIAPYNVSFSAKTVNPIKPSKQWTERVRLRLLSVQASRIISLLPKAYEDAIRLQDIPTKQSSPLKGLGIGRRMRWLKSNTKYIHENHLHEKIR